MEIEIEGGLAYLSPEEQELAGCGSPVPVASIDLGAMLDKIVHTQRELINKRAAEDVLSPAVQAETFEDAMRVLDMRRIYNGMASQVLAATELD